MFNKFLKTTKSVFKATEPESSQILEPMNLPIGVHGVFNYNDSNSKLEYPVVLGKWLKKTGDYVFKDECICEYHTSKFRPDSPLKLLEQSPVDGILFINCNEGAILKEGDIFYLIQEGSSNIEQQRFKIEISKISVQKNKNGQNTIKFDTSNSREIWATLTKNDFEEYPTINIGPPTIAYYFHDIYD